jgi:AraC-like DNA-binding protein
VHVYLEPLGVRCLLGVPAAALASRVVDLGELLGTGAEELRERLLAAPSWGERFQQLDGLLLRVRRDAPEPPPEVAWAWHTLVAVHGNLSVVALAREVGWSRRHLGERFRAALGLAPKQAARVLRFEWACEELARAPRRPLADLALACGYHDQPHLTREWQALAGTTPAQWIARELPFVQDFRTEP